MMVPMAGKRPWGAGVFAATAVAALALLAGRAGVPVLHAGADATARAAQAVTHTPIKHAVIGRPAWRPDTGPPGGLAVVAAVVAVLILCTVSPRRTRVPSAAPGSRPRVRAPPA
jgi:hypothetical protein